MKEESARDIIKKKVRATKYSRCNSGEWCREQRLGS